MIGTALASETTYLIDKGPSYIDDIESWLDDTFGVQLEFDRLKDEFLEGGGLQTWPAASPTMCSTWARRW